MQYASSRPLQEALRLRLRELAATHVRYAYRRLTVLLLREGWKVNAEENLKVRSVERKRISRLQRVAQVLASRPNQSGPTACSGRRAVPNHRTIAES